MSEQNEIKVEREAASEQDGRSVPQIGAGASVRCVLRAVIAACAKLLPITKNATLHDPASRRRFYVRRALVYVVCLVVYILLDRSAMFLQMWPNISAWYPPVGFAVALLIGLGPEILPLLTFSSYLSGIINYHQGYADAGSVLTTLLLPIGYGSASLFLRRRFSTSQPFWGSRCWPLEKRGHAVTIACERQGSVASRAERRIRHHSDGHSDAGDEWL